MKTKTKKFSHKLLALVMAVVMGMTCFSGVFSAQAASADVKYNDEYVEYNDLAWRILSDEQAATALLDYLDIVLADVGPGLTKSIGKVISGLGVSVLKWDEANRQIKLNAVVVNATIDFHLYSVNELLHTLESVDKAIGKLGTYIGDAGNIQLSSTKGMTRQNTSSCDILRGVLGILQKNCADYNGKDVIGQFLRGGFGLGTVGNLANLDIYEMLRGALGLDPGYQSNFIYNLVQGLLFNNTNWFTDEEKAAYKADPSTFVYDEVLLDKMTTKLLTEINAEITYKGVGEATESSKTRYANILAKVEKDGVTFKQAAESLGYDPELNYTSDGNVKLFVYGTKANGTVADDAAKISLVKTDSLFKFGFQALNLAWKTALKDTVATIRVNYNAERGHGSNFDNAYYYWAIGNANPIAWDTNDLASMYSETNVRAWANAVYADYGAADADEFLGWVRNNYEFDREGIDTTGSWRDIDATTLFNKLRYSPLADYYFNMETGPINLYFMQTGSKNLDAFFADANYNKYTSLVGGLNDALVAAVKDLFVDNAVRPNVYGDNNRPTLNTVNPAEINSASITQIVNTLVGNAAAVIEYTADATDANILKAFHTAHPGVALSESNLEEAMLPMLIACIGQIHLNNYDMREYIHPEDWDACKDAEGVIFLALREYLSYILPNKNYNPLITKDSNGKIVATLNGTILPMARDAVAYVMQGYVPYTDKNGNAWDVYTASVNDSTTIFDLLNSVVCYYGGEYTFKNSNVVKDTGAMAVGALLGVCDENGKSQIVTTNTLWQNIDLVANKFFPVLGELQYGDKKQYGHFNSEDLIWNDIVLGILDIADTSIHTATNMGGVSNFCYRFLTIISATPIQTTPIVGTVYDVVRDLLHGMFNARYTSKGQTFKDFIPARVDKDGKVLLANPWDNVIQRDVIVGTDGASANLGYLQKAICNLVEFSGYGTKGAKTYPDSILRGAMFALSAVQSFIPGILGSIGDHTMNMATAKYKEMTVGGCTSGNAVTSEFTFTNNSIGINNAYVNNDQIAQLDRYYVKIQNIVVNSETGSGSVTGWNANTLIGPNETVTLTATSNYVPDTSNGTKLTAVVKYSICDKNGNVLYPNLETYAYQYLTGAKGWADIVYPTDRGGQLAQALEDNTAGKTKTSNGYTAYTSSKFRDGKLHVGYPEYLVIMSDNLAAINRYQFRFRNTTNGTFGSDYGMDGVFCYDETTVYNDGSNGNVTVNNTNAIPIFDPETGDLIKYGRFDVLISKEDKAAGTTTYYDQDGKVVGTVTSTMTDEQKKAVKAAAWDRGTVWGHMESEDDAGTGALSVNNIMAKFSADDGYTVVYRDHHAYTLDEAKKAGIIGAYHFNNAGICEYVYMATGSGTNYDTTLGQVSLRGPVDGIYINQGKITVPKGKSVYTSNLFVYDGSTPIQAGSYKVNLCCYSSGGSGSLNTGNGCTLVVGDNASAESLNGLFNDLNHIVNSYSDSDYTDLSKKTEANNALLKSLEAQAAAITPTTALSMSDKTYYTENKLVVATEYGDSAYVPYSSANDQTVPQVTVDGKVFKMPAKVMADAFFKDGYWYYDEACTMPIYSPKPLTAADVVNGKDKAGKEVIEGTGQDAGKYWLRNTPYYETEWDLTTYANPWKRPTNVQATNGNGDLLYEKVEYVYRDADALKVNSDFVWACKFPSTQYACIENSGVVGEADNRGTYTQMADLLEYTKEQVYSAINTNLAQNLFTKVSQEREDLNNNNFEVVTYNRMTGLARTAEKGYTLNIPYTTEVPVVDEAGNTVTYTEPVFDEKGNMIHKVGDVVTETKSKVDKGVKFADYKKYLSNPNIVVDEAAVTTSTTLSSVQVREYIRLYDIYKAAVVERGYNGNQLEAEILCAAGNSYNVFTATPATYDENNGGAKLTDGVVNVADGTSVPFGAVENGKLVNNGPVKFAPQLWTNYVDALAKAVSIATEAHTTYKYASSANFVPADKDAYTCQVTDCYNADTDLQAAEVALEMAKLINVADVEGGTVAIDGTTVSPAQPYGVANDSWVEITAAPAEGYALDTYENMGTGYGQVQTFEKVVNEETGEKVTAYGMRVKGADATVTPVFVSTAPTGFNVSASLVVATKGTGATNNVAVNGDYTITLTGADGTTVATTTFTSAKDANTFTIANVPNGTYTATITSDYSLERTVTVIVNGADISGTNIPVLACDFDKSGTIGAADVIPLYKAASSGSTNLVFDLDGSQTIGAADAIVLNSCSSGGNNLPAITLQ